MLTPHCKASLSHVPKSFRKKRSNPLKADAVATVERTAEGDFRGGFRRLQLALASVLEGDSMVLKSPQL